MVVSHPDRPTLAQRALQPGGPLGKWLKGSSKPSCTVQINEGIVGTSELMGVTSEAAERSLKTRTLRMEASAETGCRDCWPSLSKSWLHERVGKKVSATFHNQGVVFDAHQAR